MTFQSRFGREEWLRPYTDETVLELAQGGEEPGDRHARLCRRLRRDAGGDRDRRARVSSSTAAELHARACLNAAADHIALLADLVRRELGGWI